MAPNASPYRERQPREPSSLGTAERRDPQRIVVDFANRVPFKLGRVSGKARQVGAALMRGWTELNEKDLDMIAQILSRRGKSK